MNATFTLPEREAEFAALTRDAAQVPGAREALPGLAQVWDDRREALAWLAGHWGDHGETVEWLALRALTHPSLGVRDHGGEKVCNGPHLDCWWETYRDARERAAEEDTEVNQEFVAEAEDVLIHGMARGLAGNGGTQ